MSICLDDVAAWMRSNRLLLNTSKTELLCCATACRQSQLPCTPLRVGRHLVNPASTVRDLGIYIDADLSGRTHNTENNGVVFCCSVTAADSTSVPAVGRLQITDRVTGA